MRMDKHLPYSHETDFLPPPPQKTTAPVNNIPRTAQSLLWSFSDNAHTHTNELQLVKSQLEHKSQLLDKVKVLLRRAAAKEKMLHNKVRIDG